MTENETDEKRVENLAKIGKMIDSRGNTPILKEMMEDLGGFADKGLKKAVKDPNFGPFVLYATDHFSSKEMAVGMVVAYEILQRLRARSLTIPL